MAFDLMLVVAGLVLLTGGGELLIRGALATALRLNVTPLLAGVVIVGFGTSAPELLVSVDAALSARPDVALGNVFGSNIANILLIIGVAALVTPLTVPAGSLLRDGGVMVAATVLALLLLADGVLTRWNGLLLVLALLAYLGWLWRTAAESALALEVPTTGGWVQRVPGMLAALAAGLALLLLGARLLVSGAVDLAAAFGVSEAVIGLTLVAVGTSLPELAVSVLAAVRRQAGLVVGNVLGSNIFNLLGVLGVTALVQPMTVGGRMLVVDQWVVLGAALLAMGLLYTGLRASRLEGALLLALYCLYLVSTVVVVG